MTWDRYNLQDGILHKEGKVEEDSVNQLCLPSALKQDIFCAYHNHLCHQGKEKILSLIKRRFYWPGMDKKIQEMIKFCGRCVQHKTAALFPSTALCPISPLHFLHCLFPFSPLAHNLVLQCVCVLFVFHICIQCLSSWFYFQLFCFYHLEYIVLLTRFIFFPLS